MHDYKKRKKFNVITVTKSLQRMGSIDDNVMTEWMNVPLPGTFFLAGGNA